MNMKANELMIGDWLKHYNGIPMQVTKITTIHFACAENGGVNCWEYNNKFEPIPLTPEILEKNGFGGNKPKVKLILEDTRELLYNIYEKELTIYWNSQVVFRSPCAYAHQLQHALKLCKIDKGIVI
jgi:hypothetical protein